MKIQNTALNALLYLVYMFGGCIAVMVVEALLVFVINKFAAIPYPALTVIRLVLYTAGVPAIMAGMGYFEGYREGRPAVGETVAGGLLATVLHLLLALLFGFQAFVAGGVRFAAGLIRHGMDITEESLSAETPTGLFLAMFAIYGVLYVGVLTLARYVGAQRREAARAELTRNN